MPITVYQKQALIVLCEEKAIHPVSLFALFDTHDLNALTEDQFNSYFDACNLIKQNGEETQDAYYKGLSPDSTAQIFAYKSSNNKRRIFYIQWKNSSLKVILFDGIVPAHNVDTYKVLIKNVYDKLNKYEITNQGLSASQEQDSTIWSLEEAKTWASQITDKLALKNDVASEQTVIAKSPLEILTDCENHANSASTHEVSLETYRLTLTTIATLHNLCATHSEIQSNPNYEICMDLLLQNWIRCILHYFHWTPYIEKSSHEYVFNSGNNKLGPITLFSNLEQVKTALERIVEFALTPDRFSKIDSQKILTIVFVTHTKLASSLGIGLFFELWKSHHKLNDLITAISFNPQEQVIFELVKLLQTSDMNMASLHTEVIDSLTRAICLFLSSPSHQFEFEAVFEYLPNLLKRTTQQNILQILSIIKNNDDIKTPVLIRLADEILENEQYVFTILQMMINRCYLLKMRDIPEAETIETWIQNTILNKSESNPYFTLQLYADLEPQTQYQLKGMRLVELDSILETAVNTLSSTQKMNDHRKEQHEEKKKQKPNRRNINDTSNLSLKKQSEAKLTPVSQSSHNQFGHYQSFYDLLLFEASRCPMFATKDGKPDTSKSLIKASFIKTITNAFGPTLIDTKYKSERKKAKLLALIQVYNAFLSERCVENVSFTNLDKIIMVVLCLQNHAAISDIKHLLKITCRFANPRILKEHEQVILDCTLNIITDEIKKPDAEGAKIGEDCLAILLRKGLSINSSEIHQQITAHTRLVIREKSDVINPLLKLLIKLGFNIEQTEVGYPAALYESHTVFSLWCIYILYRSQAIKKRIQPLNYSLIMRKDNATLDNLNYIFASNSKLYQQIRYIQSAAAKDSLIDVNEYNSRYEEEEYSIDFKIIIQKAQALIDLGAKSNVIFQTQQHVAYNLTDLAMTFECDQLIDFLNQLHCSPLAKRNPHLIMYTPHYKEVSWVEQWFELHTEFRNSLNENSYEEFIPFVLSHYKEFYSMSSMSFILIAMEVNHYDAVKFILDNSDPSLLTTFLRIPNYMNIHQANCITPIEYGLEYGHFETIERLLTDFGDRISLVNEQGSSLHALFRGLRKLRDSGIKPNPTYSDIEPVIKALMRAGTSFDQEMNDQPVIRFGISSGFGDLIRSILQNKSELEKLRTQPSFPDADVNVTVAAASTSEASTAEAATAASEQEGAYATPGPDDDSDNEHVDHSYQGSSHSFR